MNSYRPHCVVQASCAAEELQTLSVTFAKNKYNKGRIWELLDPEDGDTIFSRNVGKYSQVDWT